MGSADEEPGCAAASALSARDFDGRLPGGAGGASGKGGAEPVGGGDFQTDGRVEGRVRPLAEARPIGAAIRVCLGGRCLPAGSDGRQRRMHAGADRCDAGGQEGACRLPGWRSRKRAELAWAPGRGEAARVEDRPRNRRRRRCARLLEGDRRGLSRNTAPAVLGAQDGERVEPVSYTHLRAHETRHDLVCRLLLEKKKKTKKKQTYK